MTPETTLTDLTGKLLIALPDIGDDRFERAVILVCSHDDEHTMGIVLNQTIEGLQLSELLNQLEVPVTSEPASQDVVSGGPVGQEQGFVLHSADYENDGSSLTVLPNLRLTTTKEALHAIVSDQPPRKSLFALGYTGWGPQQVEQELADNAWLVADADENIVFDRDYASKWDRALHQLGISGGILQSDSGRA